MLVTLIATLRLLRIVGRALMDPATRGILATSGFMVAGGSLFYVRAEGWSWLDSLYFCVVTLTTIGFGDLAPTAPLSKLFTIVFSLLGIGVLAALISSISISARKIAEEHRSGREADGGPEGAAPGS